MSDRVVVIIQARMGSTRLPGKVLLDIEGKPMIDRVVERARRIGGVSEVMVATSRLPADDVLAEHITGRLGAPVFRGSESDVLSRYVGAARDARADVVVRVTSDCPLLCPEVSERVVKALVDAGRDGADYANNTMQATFPRGLDTEAVWMSVLETADAEATEQRDREHVTPFIYLHPERFRLVAVRDEHDRSSLRWTVDTDADLAMVRALVRAARGGADADYRSLLAAVDADPSIAALNAAIVQKQL